ncbi:MAG: DUF4173 domain-containing protein [Pseudomonadales bacterium]|nr:DUF4173 domain-containing protein [Pseudomonadales bacterium]
MENRQYLSIIILGLSGLYGIFAQYLFVDMGLGFNVTVYLWLMTTLLVAFQYYQRKSWNRLSVALAGFTLFFALSFSIYESFALLLLNSLGLLLILMLSVTETRERCYYKISELLLALLRLFFLPIVALARLLPDALLPTRTLIAHPHLRSILKGLLWALPILWMFGSLLISSDLRFERFTDVLFDVDMLSLSESFLYTLFFAAITTAVLYYIALHQKSSVVMTVATRKLPIDGIQIMTIMSCINLLFASYIAVQFTYFFGGDALVTHTQGVTYSSYARKGFWDLVLIAVIALPLLYLADDYLKDDAALLQRLFRYQALFTIAAIALMECSAAHRMVLYVSEYHLTALRFYSTWFMCFIVSCLLIFVATVLAGARQRFIISVCLSALMFIAVLNLINPDATIAKSNIAKLESGQHIDKFYLSQLSMDALPVVSQHAINNDAELACKLLKRFAYTTQRDWQEQSWFYQRHLDSMKALRWSQIVCETY